MPPRDMSSRVLRPPPKDTALETCLGTVPTNCLHCGMFLAPSRNGHVRPRRVWGLSPDMSRYGMSEGVVYGPPQADHSDL